MGGDVIANIVKSGLIFVVVCLLGILIWQGNAVEERVLDLEATADSATERLEAKIDDLGETVQETTRRIQAQIEDLAASGVRVSGPATGTTGPRVSGADPRTLPYWKTDDNILADPALEPKPPDGAPHGGVIRYYTGSNPRTLHVHVGNEAELQERICGPVYEYIADQSRRNPDDFVAGICNRATVNEDFTEFTCYVRKGMYWHSPFLTPAERRGHLAWLGKLPRQEVTADDVKFNFDIVRDPLSECGPLASYLEDIESVEVVDRYTVKVSWKKSRYYNKSTTFNLIMIYPRFIYTRDEDGKPLDPELIAPTYPQHWFNNKMCGTGPFRFAGFEPNQYIRLRRNDDWWNPDKPVIDGVDLRIVSERPVQLAMFKAGELDLLSANPNDYRAEVIEGGAGSIKEMIEAGTVSVKKWEMFAYYFIGWNMRLPQLRERDVRRALAHLYPRGRVIRDIYHGLAVPHNGPVHRWATYYDKDLETIAFDVEKASGLLDAAGWKLDDRGVRSKVVDGQSRELRIKLLYPAQSTVARDTVLLYQKSAGQAGVQIEPFPREWSVMTKLLDDKDFEASMLGWGNTWDSDPSQIWASRSALSAKGSNFVSYIVPRLDEIIEQLEVEFDQARRHALWREFQAIIVRDQPYCFTHIRTRTWLVNNRLGNHYFAKLRPQDWFLPWFVKDGK